ncbi:MAG: nucleotide pyrophosphatase/phosphodiesterase family protein [Kiritimatiellia bacterium]
MKHLILSVAGLGWEDLERSGGATLCGLRFAPSASVFPALTCVVQGTLRTGLLPCVHGMTSNGYYSKILQKPSFWEQSSALVRGGRIWERARSSGSTVGMFFFQQSLGETVDALVSPAPIHRHGGGMIMANYAQPEGAAEAMRKKLGTFPLWRYWGPLASAKAGDSVLEHFLVMRDRYDPDICFLYLPTLDYEAQRYGPLHPRSAAAFERFRRELERLVALAKQCGSEVTVLGEYAIGKTTMAPVYPNKTLRRYGLFFTRDVGGRLYPDFAASKAFAMVDHEIAHVYVRHPEDVEFVRSVLAETGEYERVEVAREGAEWAHSSAGQLLLLARQGSWCAYPWWGESREAPDWATHIDIHNKPGYDPCELFFNRRIPIPPSTCQNASRIGGTHGRCSRIAVASTAFEPADTYLENVKRLQVALDSLR